MELNKKNTNMCNSKKGIYYSMDALLAGLLLIGVVVLLMNIRFSEPSVQEETYLSQDILSVLSTLRIEEQSHPFITQAIANNSIDDPSRTFLNQIGIFWALNDSKSATTLIEIIMNQTFSDNVNMRFNIESESLFLKNESSRGVISTSSRMISGIAKNAPLSGFSASAYLKKVRNKKTSSYAFMGGFVGQGNITMQLTLPSDFDQTKYLSSELKLETPGTFLLDINNVPCGTTYSGSQDVVSLFNLDTCNASFTAGNNSIAFTYTSSLNQSYISGGVLKVTYMTDSISDYIYTTKKRYRFPEITGFLNFYDAISAQGLTTDIDINLNFYNRYDTFFTLGNETIFIASGKNTTQNIVYSLSDQLLPPAEIPIRLGTTNLSNITIATEGDPVDAFLVTDVSGSMDDCGQYYTEVVPTCRYEYRFFFWWVTTECSGFSTCAGDACGTGYSNTRNHQVYDKDQTFCNATLLDIAKDSSKLFTSLILNDSSSPNQIGLSHYSTNGYLSSGLSNDRTILDNIIDNYVANGWTCTCCGINRARNQIMSQSTSENQAIIVLSDGDPNYYCLNLNDYTGRSGNTPLAETRAIEAAQEACNNGITVYAVGFGDGMSANGHNIMRQIACNSSLYFDATDVANLASIYEYISSQILVAANYSSQTISVVGDFELGTLEGSSYIDLSYIPISSANQQGQISLTFESEQFNGCSASIYIPEGIEIADAYVTSFSGSHWTKEVVVNGQTVFNLNDYGSDYQLLGDPFTIQIPHQILESGMYNQIELEIGDAPGNWTACSANNTLIYTALINASIPRSETLEVYDGCTWSIQSEADRYSTITIPPEYTGTNTCVYNATTIAYNPLDAYDFATHSLLMQLDPDKNGKVLVDLTESDLEITITIVSGIPYMWGPSVVSVDVWK